jgi:hypothetical protein
MKSFEKRIESLESRLNVRPPEIPRIVMIWMCGGAFSGEPHYAWAREDMADLIERGDDEGLEAFRKRADKLVPEGDQVQSYWLAPKIEEWGASRENDADLIERIQEQARQIISCVN